MKVAKALAAALAVNRAAFGLNYLLRPRQLDRPRREEARRAGHDPLAGRA